MSARKRLDSEPPTPDLSSMSAPRWAVCEGGTRSRGKVSVTLLMSWEVREVYSSRASARIDGSGSAKS